jgi:hypothetical protein
MLNRGYTSSHHCLKIGARSTLRLTLRVVVMMPAVFEASVMGRLKPGGTVERASAEMAAGVRAWASHALT